MLHPPGLCDRNDPVQSIHVPRYFHSEIGKIWNGKQIIFDLVSKRKASAETAKLVKNPSSLVGFFNIHR